MTNKPTTSTLNALTPEEKSELDNFLLSALTSDETMMLDTLDGYLTAIVSGPMPLQPSSWLPRVWGASVSDEPAFETMDQAQRIFDLIVKHMNSITDTLRQNPDALVPIFDTLVYHGDSREYADGEMWAHGYMTGIALSQKDWQPLLDDADGLESLRPIYLLGSDEVSPDELALSETAEQREEIGKDIPASAAWIYRYWQPLRQAQEERMTPAATRCNLPKAGRNDPCPCSSGKKFKKCCGATTSH